MIIEHTKKHIRVSFDYPLRTVSSSLFGGGYGEILNIVNLSTDSKEVRNNDPKTVISDFLDKKDLHGETVGLLTSAPMEYAQAVLVGEEGINVLAIVTAGVSNALNAAERSPVRFCGEPGVLSGTINVVVITNACLFDECMVSSVMTITEAKAASLYDLKVKSIVTGNQATGTGTDAVVVVSGRGKALQYAGGHTLYGQLLGQSVSTGIKLSLLKKKTRIDKREEIYKSFDF